MSSANIDLAVKTRWDAQGMDFLFKRFWQDPTLAKVHPLNAVEARPKTPMPYAVYETFAPVRQFRSTGSTCEPENEVEYLNQLIQFRLHGKTPVSGERYFGRTGKDILREIVGQSEPNGWGLLKAFDDATGALELGGNDRFMCTITEPDFSTREDDDVWVWVVPFTIQFERRRKLREVPAS